MLTNNIWKAWSTPVVIKYPAASDGLDGASGGLYTWKGYTAIPGSTTIGSSIVHNIGNIQNDGLLGLHVQVKSRGVNSYTQQYVLKHCNLCDKRDKGYFP